MLKAMTNHALKKILQYQKGRNSYEDPCDPANVDVDENGKSYDDASLQTS